MTDITFWEYIDLIDWSQPDDERIVKPLVAALQRSGAESIVAFEAVMTNKLRALDTKAHAAHWSDERGRVRSVDSFLYARAAVVASGRKTYDAILEEPTHFPSDTTYEPLLEVANTAYKQLTGQPLPLAPTDASYETYHNREGWLSL